MSAVRNCGRVKFFNGDKGFGFIVPDAGGPDVFVHVTDVPEGLVLDQETKVTYMLGEGRQGKPKAIDVQLA